MKKNILKHKCFYQKKCKWLPVQANRAGFSLVEVLIVVGIIAMLAWIAIPNLLRARTTANQTAAQVALKLISNAMEHYASVNSVYPTTTTLLIGASPPYLSVDYFTGTHNGYAFTSTLADYSYTVTAAPSGPGAGTSTFTVTTGGVLQAL
jgi:prepilin-type N-terminal cleavage/methylation domain-containing protein